MMISCLCVRKSKSHLFNICCFCVDIVGALVAVSLDWAASYHWQHVKQNAFTIVIVMMMMRIVVIMRILRMIMVVMIHNKTALLVLDGFPSSNPPRSWWWLITIITSRIINEELRITCNDSLHWPLICNWHTGNDHNYHRCLNVLRL